jgi:hypothetical protein
MSTPHHSSFGASMALERMLLVPVGGAAHVHAIGIDGSAVALQTIIALVATQFGIPVACPDVAA